MMLASSIPSCGSDEMLVIFITCFRYLLDKTQHLSILLGVYIRVDFIIFTLL